MKTITALLIALGFLVPVLAEAKSAPKDRKAPSIVSLHVESSNANPSIAVPGDTVSLSITASEKIQRPVVLVNAKPVFLRATNSSGNKWVASYTVGADSRQSKVAWAIVMADTSDNIYACTSPRIFLIPYCPTTDGSSVTITDEAPPPPGDTTPPVIEEHEDVSVSTTTASSMPVSYTPPTATDETDGEVPVSCTPASGSTFAAGTTTVTCTAEDAAGNSAQSSFDVHVKALYIMSEQGDESYLCGETTGTWRSCDESFTFGFTDTTGSGVATIDLGLGSTMGEGTLESVTIANTPADIFHPWLVTLTCYEDAGYTQACSDWDSMSQSASQSSDGVHWTAEFDPVVFVPAHYYRMTIDDTGWDAPAYGSESLQEAYFVIRGMTQ